MSSQPRIVLATECSYHLLCYVPPSVLVKQSSSEQCFEGGSPQSPPHGVLPERKQFLQEAWRHPHLICLLGIYPNISLKVPHVSHLKKRCCHLGHIESIRAAGLLWTLVHKREVIPKEIWVSGTRWKPRSKEVAPPSPYPSPPQSWSMLQTTLMGPQ